ncbi:TonB-dependent receptor [Chitinophaga sp. HK235]|uniref:TonB-dependent receptor n=1 Tax=Chitinophaga sp. HK235 TaxID=2952571 RepID=UPI001BAAA901|nr:TonB-dependent receptor [Chitinophaga sp. HK235]
MMKVSSGWKRLRSICQQLLLLLLLCLAGNRLPAQVSRLAGNVTLQMDKASVADVIASLQKQTGYVFSYDKNRLSAIMVRDIHWQQIPLGKALTALQEKAGLEYTMLDNNIAVAVRKSGHQPESIQPAGNGAIKGRIVDFETSQPLPGATVSIPEAAQTVISDEKGYYHFKKVPAGKYTLVITYTGYQKKTMQELRLQADREMIADVKMQAGKTLEEVVIQSGVRKVKAVTHSTERELLNELRGATGVVSGISSELINRTADRNAAEVVKRISGVTVVDNRFIVVRGMNERYNITYLNDNIAPSTEMYSKAFAYDLLPSSIIDKILVFKSPRPDLNGEFAGAAVKVYTKNAVPVKHIDVGIQLAHRPGSTMTDIDSYRGGKMDWLGIDDGTRKMPNIAPTYFQSGKDTRHLSQADILREFSPVLSTQRTTSTPDMQVFFNYYNAFHLGKAWLYNLSSVTYTKETTGFDVYRQTGNTDAYMTADVDLNLGVNNQRIRSKQSTETGKINVLENFTLKMNPRHTLQFKNFFVNDGRRFTSINDIEQNVTPRIDSIYSNTRSKNIILSFQQRILYSGNLGGTHDWGNTHKQRLEWNLGYTYDQQNVPDQRISRFMTSSAQRPADASGLAYTVRGSNNGDADAFLGMVSRLYVKNNEDVYNGALDYTFHASKQWELKAGTYQSFKRRNVSRRFFRVNRGGLGPNETSIPGNEGASSGWPQGYGLSNPSLIYFHLQDLDRVWSTDYFQENKSGLELYDATSPVDKYVASEQYNAFYGMGSWKTPDEKLTLNGGVRVEYDRQKLTGATAPDNGSLHTVFVDHPKTSILPSVNFSYRPTNTFVVRTGWGRTVNRPEFRELTPYNDFDFMNNERVVGSQQVVTATIDNYDLRLEYYPHNAEQNEVFSVGGFYKYLQDPIERMREEKSGYADGYGFTAISFANAKEARVYGLEAEIKKSLAFLGGGFFKRLSIALNGTWVKSSTQRLITNHYAPGVGRDTLLISGRALQGQSPYVLNAGLFYEHPGTGTKIGVTYNINGPVIYAKSIASKDVLFSRQDTLVFNSTRPDMVQLPMHLLDLSITQRIVKSLKVKFSIQNLLDQAYRIVEDKDYNQRYNKEYPVLNGKGETYYEGDNIYTRYKPGRYFQLGFTYAF